MRRELFGRTLHVAPTFDEGVVPDIRKWFESYYTIQFANYPVDEHYLAHGGTRVDCGWGARKEWDTDFVHGPPARMRTDQKELRE